MKSFSLRRCSIVTFQIQIEHLLRLFNFVSLLLQLISMIPSNFRHLINDDEQPLRIHVGNIPFLWTIDDLRKQFLVFGPVKDPEIVSNERGSKGFGFITFLRYSDGINAIRVKNGSIADGRKITVALASSRSSSQLVPHRFCCCQNHFARN